MRIPKDDAGKLDLYQEVIAACKASRQRRLEQYALNRRWYIYGTDDGTVSPWAKIYSHLDQVTSFLYAQDSTRFSVRMGAGAPKSDYGKTGAFAKKVTEEWKASNADIVYGQAILWALIYDSTFVKHIRRGGAVEPFLVDPGSFGVYREDVPMLDRQEAFVHWWYMTESDLRRRLKFHPQRDKILAGVSAALAKEDTGSQVPPLLDRIITNAVTPDLIGEANILVNAPPDYQAQISVPLVEMAELWVWNDAEDDYQTVTVASDTMLVYDRRNLFIQRAGKIAAEQPFVQVCPNPLYDYFYGIAECARLIPLQMELNDAHADLKKLYKKQVDPPTAWEGMGLVEEKMDAFNNPGSYLAGEPGTKPHQMKWEIPAEAHRRIEKLEEQFEETSGITRVTAGQGEVGVRSGEHAAKLASLGSSRPKKRALIIEDSLEKGATLYGKVIYCDDDTPLFDDKEVKFVPAQMDPNFVVEVDAHSNSPVFMDDQKNDAEVLLKSRSINRKRFIQMMAPPMQEELLRDLREEIIPEERAQMQAEQRAQQAEQESKDKGKLASVK